MDPGIRARGRDSRAAPRSHWDSRPGPRQPRSAPVPLGFAPGAATAAQRPGPTGIRARRRDSRPSAPVPLGFAPGPATARAAPRSPGIRARSRESGAAPESHSLRHWSGARVAERVGFEPTVGGLPLHTLSKRAPSTPRTSLRAAGAPVRTHKSTSPPGLRRNTPRSRCMSVQNAARRDDTTTSIARMSFRGTRSASYEWLYDCSRHPPGTDWACRTRRSPVPSST